MRPARKKPPSGRFIDISVPVRAGMAVWPGDPQVELERLQDITEGDEANVSRIAMGAHSGTHVDAPLHYIPGAADIGSMPPEALAGPARVIEARGDRSGRIGKGELEAHGISRGERILLKTGNSAFWRRYPGLFREGFAHLGAAAADFLVQTEVLAVGIDYLSVGGCGSEGALVHRTLLEAGIWIIEGLDLSCAAPGAYELICLPLRIEGSEAAPARALLRPVPRR